ncbi:hypothetical protein HYFRA_00003797 [Hymenoscyphus fraxineus]|uniref:Uncharacterized protein n=1 Tax=Hymenoscyphus fraxineus TaxID=746836 RepID=A0A9N9KYY3_9HELO|nr:hypothetical protein HYFRA_00003797 [Hymenoscyphus fraxineus]
MSTISRLVRNGSHSSTSSISLDTSSHSHVLSQSHSILDIKSWLEESFSPINTRYERFATGNPTMGMAVLTRSMMEMHIVQAPDVRGMIDCLPVAHRQAPQLLGWRKKLGTWPLSKHEALVAREFAA